MKHIYHTLFVALMLVSGAVSCRRQAPELTNPNDLRVNTESPSQVFLAFWQGMNNSYGFWDIDPTDWDAVYDHYLPIFERLDTELATLPTTMPASTMPSTRLRPVTRASHRAKATAPRPQRKALPSRIWWR